MGVEFEWDAKKARSNKATHRVDFQEALTVLPIRSPEFFEDEEHSEEDGREIIIGHSVKRRVVLVCFTVRDRRIRIISCPKSDTRRA